LLLLASRHTEEWHTRFYGKKNESLWRVSEYLVFLTVGLYGYFAGSFLVATFQGLFKEIKYVVAEKIHRDEKDE
jgi:hypothetical protein